MLSEKAELLFWAKIQKNDCWVWIAAKNEKGYGITTVNGRTTKAHRVAWALRHGPLTPGVCVLHRCDNPPCCNPDHLFLGSRADNNRDMLAKGRHVVGGTHCGAGKYERGEAHHAAKLTAKIVGKIRADRKRLSYSALGRKYGISVSHAFKVVNNQLWKAPA